MANPYPSTYTPLPSRTTVLRNATILTAAGPLIERGSLLMQGGKIAAVGQAVNAPADALVEVGAHAFGLSAPGALGALHDAIRGVPCFRVVSSDVADACDALESLLGFGA